MKSIDNILAQSVFSREDIIQLLSSDVVGRNKLYEKAASVKRNHVGNKVYYRGLVEFSNICFKNCYYCGIRAGNKNINRYDISEDAILKAVKYAHDSHYASVVFQAGERDDDEFIEKVCRLLRKSKEITKGEIGITISVGEQSEEVYQKWFDCGAHRFLLRIESSNRELFNKIHPNNAKHDFDKRIAALRLLKKTGYQTGTGVMIGLPEQTIENLADDILFFEEFDIDMIGMGPYIEHAETPMFEQKDLLWSLDERFNMALKMIATLRLVLPDINIAAATALQAIDQIGREKALKVGANIIMPNITPTVHRTDYQLYQNKPCIDESASDCNNCLEARIKIAGDSIGYGEWGDSLHFKNKK